MDTNPYSPPTAVVADPEGTLLKRRGVFVMIVFTLLTLGLYESIWFFRRRDALNRLDSPRKLQLWPFVLFAVMTVLDLALNVVTAIVGEASMPAGPVAAFSLARLASAIVLLIQCFKTKDMLEDHLAGPDAAPQSVFATERVKLSGVMTFFFQIFYLQYIINRHIDRFEARPAGA